MRGILGVVLSACLLVGCGGVEATAEATPVDVAHVEQPLPPNCTESYRYDYYSDATYTTHVGYEICACGTYPRFRGTFTAYVVETWPPYSC